MYLLIAFYIDPDLHRCAEFLECLARNVRNPWIEQVHVFLETPSAPSRLLAEYPVLGSPKIYLIPHGRRVTYRDLFDYANGQFAGSRVIIANADIFFNQTLARLENYDLTGRLLCLSRWELSPDGTAQLFEHSCSQDAWVFDSPIRKFLCAFQLGLLGCDNRLAWEANAAGLRLANPSRSVRANHLHSSGIRRYDAKTRLGGQYAAVPPEYLDDKWLWFVVTRRTHSYTPTNVDSLLRQQRSSLVLVDCACDDRRPTLVRCDEGKGRHGAAARNRGAAAVDDDGIVCFIDGDLSVEPDFSSTLISAIDDDTFVVPDREGPASLAVLACTKAAFDRVGGIDETLLGWGEELLDLRDSLHRAGLRDRTFPADLLSASSEPVNGDSLILQIHSAYRATKRAALTQPGGTIPCTALFDLYCRIANGQPDTAGAPSAAVAFRETMGYTVARLEPGTSSHNNDSRPFESIPAVLAGSCFTQVVACSESPVEIEFLQSGRLYILVGTDWAGSRKAIEWLHGSASYDFIPALKTSRGTAFEVWSLTGETGDRITIPTQVALVARHLEKK
jgi:hypothetical protein